MTKDVSSKRRIAMDTSKESMGVFEKVSAFITKREKLFLYFSLLLTAIGSFFMFDIKVDSNGDDSYFILKAYDFLTDLSFYPGFHGPIYPFYLAFIMAFFGMKIWILKVCTASLLLIHNYFIFKTFSTHFKNYTFYVVFLLICINPALILHARITMSETLFITILSIFFYYFNSRFLISNIEKERGRKERWKKIIILSILLFTLYHTRYIGIVIFPVIGFHFLYKALQTKSYKTLLEFSAALLIVFISINLIKWLHFDIDLFSSGSQFKSLMQKDAYRSELGEETLSGFIDRFWGNSDFYLGKSLVRFFGFEGTESGLFKVCFYILFLYTLYKAFKKKNNLLFYIGLFSLAGMILTFLILQTFWAQDRMILVYMPFILLQISLGLTQLFKKENTLSTYLVNFLLSGMLILSAKTTINLMVENQENFQESIKGNNLYSLTPDKENYAKACIYAAASTPDTSRVWCRKPNIAGIYGESSKKFLGIYRIPVLSLEEAFPEIKQQTQQVRIILKYDDLYKVPKLFNWMQKFIHTIMYGSRKANDEENNIIYIAYQSFSQQDHETLIGYLHQSKVPYETDVKKFSEKFSSLTITSPDKMLHQLQNGGEYIIQASLRLNEEVNNGYTINTIFRFLQSIIIKYPNLLILEKAIGESEQAYLYKINYPKR